VAAACRRDGLRITVPGPLRNDREMADFYATSRAVVLTSEVDCNPRVIYEGLFTDTPFLTTEAARIPTQLEIYLNQKKCFKLIKP